MVRNPLSTIVLELTSMAKPRLSFVPFLVVMRWPRFFPRDPYKGSSVRTFSTVYESYHRNDIFRYLKQQDNRPLTIRNPSHRAKTIEAFPTHSEEAPTVRPLLTDQWIQGIWFPALINRPLALLRWIAKLATSSQSQRAVTTTLPSCFASEPARHQRRYVLHDNFLETNPTKENTSTSSAEINVKAIAAIRIGNRTRSGTLYQDVDTRNRILIFHRKYSSGYGKLGSGRGCRHEPHKNTSKETLTVRKSLAFFLRKIFCIGCGLRK